MARRRLHIRLEGPLLIGGYSAPTGYLDATTAADASGMPLIPASALKGALREAVTRLHDGCTVVSPCKPPCFACQLFGAPGTGTKDLLAGRDESGDAPIGRLRVSDARPGGDHETMLRASLTNRHGVSLDRKLRSARPGLLFEREVLDAPGGALVADLEGDLSSGEWQRLERAIALVNGIGNSRTRGLGRVQLKLEEASERAAEKHVLPKQVPRDGLALVEIEAREPLVIGGLPPASNFVESLDFVPGSALRGALGNAAAKLGKEDAFARAFLHEKHRLMFSDLLPADGDGLPVPVPRSSVECKHRERADHGNGRGEDRPVDGLIGAALLDRLLNAHGGGFVERRCPECGEPLKRAGGRWPRVNPSRRIVTRLARDVGTGSALPGMLYSVEQIQAGARFRGTVARLDAEALALLRALEQVDLRIGRGRNRGQGLVRLRIVEGDQHVGTGAVERRVKSFARAMQPFARIFTAPGGAPAGGLLAVLARTDVALDPATVAARIAEALFKDSRAPVAAFQSTTHRSGWDEGKAGAKAGFRPLRPCVAAGSAWLFPLEAGAALDMKELARVECEGVGEATELGLGRLVIDHPLFES